MAENTDAGIPAPKSHRILSFSIRDYRRIRVLEHKLDDQDNLVLIGGDNEQGKSSALDALEAALAGPQRRVTDPVRKGAKTASVIVQTSAFRVERRWYKEGGKTKTDFVVYDSMNLPSGAGKDFLDSFLGATSLDPYAFSQMQPIEQRETVCRLADPPVSWSTYRKEKDEALADEREKDKYQKLLEGQAKELALNADESAGTELKDPQTLSADVTAARERLEDAQAVSHKLSVAAADIETIEKEIAALQEKLALRKKYIEDHPAPDLDVLTAAVEEAQSRLAEVDAFNAKVRANIALATKREEWKTAEEARAEAARTVEAVEAKFRFDLQAAEFPVPGLSVDDDGVTLHGVPFGQASQAEKIRTGCMIALKQKGRLPFLLVRDGSLLGKKSMRILAEIADEYGAQVFVERVTDPDDPRTEEGCSIVIEDGREKAHGEEPSGPEDQKEMDV